jgi:hypothetical protein
MHRELWYLARHVRQLSASMILLVFLLVGCGGGSGDGAPPSDAIVDPPPNDSNDTDQQSLNGSWQGRLFSSRWGTYVDLSTGLTTQIANGEGDVEIYPRRDGREYVSRIQNFRLEQDDECYGFLIDVDRIEIRDINSNLLSAGFDVYGDLWGVAKLSPDGEAVAVRWESRKGCS